MDDMATPTRSASRASSPHGAEREQYDQLAKAAASGLISHSHVEGAVVEISGGPGELIFHLNCAVISEVEASAVRELVTDGVIPDLERMLGEAFVSRDLKFSFAAGA